MKTGRRHELETNQLADSLGHWVERARPYTNAIVAAVLIVLVTITVYAISQRRTAAGNALAWEQYMAALNRLDRDKLEDIGENNPRTQVGEWALCMAADLFLAEGSNQLFRDRGLAKEYLHKAGDHYQTVLSEARDSSLLKQASFGRARTHECLGDVKSAQDEYEAVARKWPDTPFAAAAEARVKDLKRQETREFYDWFATQNVRGVSPGGSGLPGFRPPFDMGNLPDATGLPGGNLPQDGGAPSDGTAPAADSDGPAADSGSSADPSAPAAEDKTPGPSAESSDGKSSDAESSGGSDSGPK